MKILVAYDGSNAAMEAMKLAVRHAKAFEAEIVYVITSLKGDDHDNETKIKEAQSMLESAKDYLSNESFGVETHLLVRGMAPGEDLVEFARQREVDEIILAVTKRSKLGKLIFGSNAQYVILNAHCPVVATK